jgi:hypothetical protein
MKGGTYMNIENTNLNTWFERDRAHVELENASTGETIVEFWDEELFEMADDGFIILGRGENILHESVFNYADESGLL